MPGDVAGIPISIMIDNGSQVSLLSKKQYDKLPERAASRLVKSRFTSLLGADRKPLNVQVLGESTLLVQVGAWVARTAEQTDAVPPPPFYREWVVPITAIIADGAADTLLISDSDQAKSTAFWEIRSLMEDKSLKINFTETTGHYVSHGFMPAPSTGGDAADTMEITANEVPGDVENDFGASPKRKKPTREEIKSRFSRMKPGFSPTAAEKVLNFLYTVNDMENSIFHGLGDGRGVDMPGLRPLTISKPPNRAVRRGLMRSIPPKDLETRKEWEKELIEGQVLRVLNGTIHEHPDVSIHPVHMAVKTEPSGEIKKRPVVDFVFFNALIESIRTELPNMQLLMNGFRGCDVFCNFDHYKGYYGVKVHPDAQKHLGIMLHDGRIAVFTCLPMGLSTSPGAYQDFHQLLVAGLTPDPACPRKPFVDDLGMGAQKASDAETQEQRDHRFADRVIEYLQHCVKFNVRISIMKCWFFTEELHFLGMITDGITVRANEERFAVFDDILPLRGEIREAIRRFLGLIVWHGKGYLLSGHLPWDYYHHVSSLHKLLTMERLNRSAFTAAHEESARWLLEQTLKGHTRLLPDYAQPAFLCCDASLLAWGWALIQFDPVTGLPGFVAADAKAFTPQQRAWCPGVREAYCPLMAVRKIGASMLRYFTTVYVRLDHQALMSLANTDVLMLQRFGMELSQCANFYLMRVRGPTHVAADSLSRIEPTSTDVAPSIYVPLTHPSREAPADAYAQWDAKVGGKIPLVSLITAVAELSVPEEEETEAVVSRIVADASDQPISRLQWMTEVSAMQARHPSTYWTGKPLNAVQRTVDGKAVFFCGQRAALHPADPLADTAIAFAHKSCVHRGPAETLRTLRKFATFTGDAKRVADYVASCVTCQRYQRNLGIPIVMSTRYFTPIPFACMELDHLVTKPPIAMARCVMSRHLSATVFDSTDAAGAVEFITTLKRYYSILGHITVDNAPCFTSGEFRAACELLNIEVHYSHPYVPRGHGGVEAANRMFGEALGKLTGGDIDKQTLLQVVDTVVAAYNASLVSSTGYEPTQLAFGGEAQCQLAPPVDESLPQPDLSSRNATWTIGAFAAAGAQAVNADAYNKRHGATSSPIFAVGDIVQRLSHNRSTSRHPRYEGMFSVKSFHPTKGYEIQIMMPGQDGNALFGDSIFETQENLCAFNASRANLATEALRYVGERRLAGSSFVSSIINHRQLTAAAAKARGLLEGDYQFLVRWADNSGETWEPLHDIFTKEAFKVYISSKPLIAKHVPDQFARETRVGWTTVSGAHLRAPKRQRTEPDVEPTAVTQTVPAAAKPASNPLPQRKIDSVKDKDDQRIAWAWQAYGAAAGDPVKELQHLTEVRELLKHQAVSTNNITIANTAREKLSNVEAYVAAKAASANTRVTRQNQHGPILSHSEVMEGPERKAREAAFAAAPLSHRLQRMSL